MLKGTIRGAIATKSTEKVRPLSRIIGFLRFRPLLMLILLVGFGWFIVSEIVDQSQRQSAVAVVSELGGRIGSLPFWPFGDEIFITFEKSHFSRADLDRLSILSSLKGKHSIGVVFKETNLNRDDVLYVRRILPRCFVARVVDGEQLKE